MSPCSSAHARPGTARLRRVARPTRGPDAGAAHRARARAAPGRTPVAIVTARRFAGWFADQKLGEALGGDALGGSPARPGARRAGARAAVLPVAARHVGDVAGPPGRAGRRRSGRSTPERLARLPAGFGDRVPAACRERARAGAAGGGVDRPARAAAGGGRADRGGGGRPRGDGARAGRPACDPDAPGPRRGVPEAGRRGDVELAGAGRRLPQRGGARSRDDRSDAGGPHAPRRPGRGAAHGGGAPPAGGRGAEWAGAGAGRADARHRCWSARRG